MDWRFLFLLICLFLWGCQSAPTNNDGEASNSSAIDETLEELPPLEEEYDISENKWGYINKGGRLVIRPKFDDARNFSEEKAVVRIAGKWGVVDRNGEYILAPTFKSIWSYSEGLARVQNFDLQMGF
ncbi:MAG: hypothetical protein ACI8P3_004359, partial [Saprospiraceae bacterium]